MTDIAKTVFEKYQVRKSKKQKGAFIEYVKETTSERGFECKIERGMLGAKNIIVGDPEHAKVVFTAHYDTCPRLPFPNFITPENFLIYLLYQVTVLLLFFFLPFGVIGFLFGVLSGMLGIPAGVYSIFSLALVTAFLWLLLAGPANKHTANDNTSGVTTLLDIINELPEDLKSDAAFIFFDLEESGLFGSAGYASKHKQVMKNKLIINFDCVSDGSTILFALRKKAKKYAPAIKKAFVSNEKFTVKAVSAGVFYPSDQMNFALGVGVAALKTSKKFKILYMDRIHTDKDTVYSEENIRFLVDGSLSLIAAL